jgi:hypothetical protein
MANVNIFSVGIGIIIIYLLIQTEQYLTSLKKCDCIEDKNLDTLINMEQFIIVLSGISILANIYFMLNPTELKLSNFVLIIYSLSIFIFYAYFIYIVFQFQNLMNKDCDCAMKSQRYILYTQAILYACVFISPILLFNL